MVEVCAQTSEGFLLAAPHGIDFNVGTRMVCQHESVDEADSQQSCGACNKKTFAVQFLNTVSTQDMLQILLIQRMLLVECYFSHVSLSIFM